MAKDIAFVTHQVQQGFTLVMLVQHCLTTNYARHHGGAFIIRIEDTDRKRHVEDVGERSQPTQVIRSANAFCIFGCDVTSISSIQIMMPPCCA